VAPRCPPHESQARRGNRPFLPNGRSL
jgi:hypothetical protein